MLLLAYSYPYFESARRFQLWAAEFAGDHQRERARARALDASTGGLFQPRTCILFGEAAHLYFGKEQLTSGRPDFLVSERIDCKMNSAHRTA